MKVEIDLKEITENMYQLKDTKARLEFELKQVEREIEKNELKLVVLLEKSNIDSMDYNEYSFGWKETTRKAFDQKLFNQKHPDLFEEFKIEKVNKKFEFKINSLKG